MKGLFLFFCSLQCALFSSESILCLDIGATRIKGAYVPSELSVESLKNLTPFVYPTEDWLTAKLPELFSPEGDLIADHRPVAIALAIHGPVYNHSHYLYQPKGIPYFLQQAIEERSGVPCMIENDAISFCYGALKWLEMHEEPIQFPALVVTLGTGIGVAVMHSEKELQGYEPYNLPDFTYDEFAKEAIATLGADPNIKFFGPGTEMINKFPKNLSDQERTHLFRSLFRAFLKDLGSYCSQILEIKGVIIGGGYSRFLEECDLYLAGTSHHYLMSPYYFESHGVNGDILSLLGPWVIWKDQLPPGTQNPPFEQVYEIK